MNAHDLARWTRFAGKGGIGKCTAVVDCVAQEMGEDLMFLKDDEITVLMQLPEEGFYLGHCEGVVGRFSAKDVRFHGKLKKPVMTKRTSVASVAERMSIAVVERSAPTDMDRGYRRESSDGRSTEWLGSRGQARSSSPTHSGKSPARSFSAETSFKIEGGDRDSKDARPAKAPRSASLSGSSVYSARSRRSVSTATSVSAYSTASSVSGSVATETEHTRFITSSPSTSFLSGKLPSFSPEASSATIVLSKGTDFNDTAGSVDLKLCTDDWEPVAINVASSASGFGHGTATSASNSSPTLPVVAPLRLSKSPRQTPASLPSGPSPLPSPSSGAPSTGIPGSLSPGLPRSYSSLNSPLSLAPPWSFSSASPVPSSGLSGSLSPSLSLSSGPPGSHSPSPRSPAFPSRTQVHVSSGASTSSSPLPNPYGPSSTSPYVAFFGGLSSITPPPSAPPTSPLPPAPLSGEVHETRAEKGMLAEDEHWDDFEEGNSTRLSTLDAFRRKLHDEDEEDGNVAFRSEDEEDGVVSGSWLDNASDSPGDRGSEQETEKKTGLYNNSDKGDSKVHINGEDGDSDGEVGIGLSLMGSLSGDGDDSDEDVPLGVLRGDLGAMTPGSSGSTPMPWARRTPVVPEEVLSRGQLANGHSGPSISPSHAESNGDVASSENPPPESPRETDEELEEAGEEEGGYWDDIYDDYRYSRYSLASKRFSIASRRMSVVSKVSAGSKTSGTSKGSRAPPVPVPIFPTERPSLSTERPSFSTDCSLERPSVKSDQPSEHSERDERPSLYSRPSFESNSTATSAGSSASQSNGHPLTQSFDPSLSDDTRSSLYSTQTLDRLSSQFPAVPTGVPVRVESRLRIVNDDHVERGEDVHLEMEMEVMHESTEDHATVGASVGAEAERMLVTGDHNQQTGGPSTNTEDEPEHERDSVDLYLDEADLPVGSLKSPFESPDVSVEGEALASASRAAMDTKHRSATPTVSGSPSGNLSVSRFQMTATVVDGDPFTSNSSDTPPMANLPSASNALTLSLSTEQEASQHVRPSNRTVHPFSRSSIFLPHPNAPKPAGHQGLGPMYARPVQVQPHPTGPPNTGPGSNLYPPPPPNSSTFSAPVLHRLRSASLAQGSTPLRCPPMTIFARCQPDLSTSTGPVPIVFSLEPLPPLTPSASGPPPHNPNWTTVIPPTRSATLPPPAPKSFLSGNPSAPPRLRVPVSNVSIPGETKAEVFSPTEQFSLRLPRRSVTTSATPSAPVKVATQTVTGTLPVLRPGFIPQVGGGRGARPRSRSFSALDAKVIRREVPERRREELGYIAAPVRTPGNLLPAGFASGPVPPLLTSITVPAVSSVPPVGLQPATSSSPLPLSSTSTSLAPTPSPVPGEKDTLSPTSNVSASPNPHSPTIPQPLTEIHSASVDAPEKDSMDGHPSRRSSESGDSHTLMQSPPPLPDSYQNNRSSPLTHEMFLRSKLSLPNLRGKSSTRPRLDDAVSITSSHAGLGGSIENETVQVQDMDFELVKPSIPIVSGRASQDSVVGQELRLDPGSPGLLGDTASIHSGAPRSPLAANEQASGGATDTQAAADAHRQREVRWMALMPTVPPSQARKNKKVKRLLQDGVPSSLRYLVWCHLTDSKARALPGVYNKLGKRPRVPAFTEIENDSVRCFPDQPQLHNTHGPIVSLLQAYLSMVPDIQYSSALTSIVGHLLLLAPEEDAFWIFASIMDAHLRSYFSTSTIQIEVDAALLSKAVEVNDPAVHKKLYVSLQMAPASITRPWFSGLFVGTLPVDHLHRIWDIFLYEGMPFLFRVGLAVIHCVRHLLLQATSEESALENLSCPPLACLPSSADEILSLCFSMKLRDDDVRKQRVKMEAQVKRQAQARTHPTNGMPNRQTTSISLPRP